MIAYKDSHLQEQLRIFNTLWKAQDDIWQEAARNSGLPETAFWIIYILTIENKAELTQAELCDTWFIPRQTCNSAVKKLEGKGLISLTTHKVAVHNAVDGCHDHHGNARQHISYKLFICK